MNQVPVPKSIISTTCHIYENTYVIFIVATGFPVWASIIASGVVGTVYTSLVRHTNCILVIMDILHQLNFNINLLQNI